jgi:hypothetical protein
VCRHKSPRSPSTRGRANPKPLESLACRLSANGRHTRAGGGSGRPQVGHTTRNEGRAVTPQQPLRPSPFFGLRGPWSVVRRASLSWQCVVFFAGPTPSPQPQTPDQARGAVPGAERKRKPPAAQLIPSYNTAVGISWLGWVRLENPLGHRNFFSGLKLSGGRDGGLGLARFLAVCPLGGHMCANGLLWYAAAVPFCSKTNAILVGPCTPPPTGRVIGTWCSPATADLACVVPPS